MTDREWKLWTVDHMTLFRWGDDHLARLDLWRPAFDGRNVTLAEMQNASMHLAQTNPRAFPSEHLELLLNRIANARFTAIQARRAQADQEARDSRSPPCHVCDGKGFVEVPHLDTIHEGEWLTAFPYKIVVCCDCRQGQARLAWFQGAAECARDSKSKSTRVPPIPLTLEQYERANPDWKNQVRRRAEEQAQLVKIQSECARQFDKHDAAPAVAEVLRQVVPHSKRLQKSPALKLVKAESECPF